MEREGGTYDPGYGCEYQQQQNHEHDNDARGHAAVAFLVGLGLGAMRDAIRRVRLREVDIVVARQEEGEQRVVRRHGGSGLQSVAGGVGG